MPEFEVSVHVSAFCVGPGIASEDTERCIESRRCCSPDNDPTSKVSNDVTARRGHGTYLTC